ncbi:hypothetical protein WCX49_01095 [Sulfurimonas sp. HSL-1656]|uniref:hypothetical protein n=1 Tax=Thiomicrolovo subterrani TaxID=3131934 RepID=UPI0031F9039E
MKLDAQYLPALTDDVFDAKRKLLRGVFWFDMYYVRPVDTQFRYIYFDKNRCQFTVLPFQKEGVLIGVKWGERVDIDAAINAAATKYNFTMIILGCIRRRMLGERIFWYYVYARPEWFC